MVAVKGVWDRAVVLDAAETAAAALRGYFDLIDEYVDTVTPQDTAARWQDVLAAAGIAPHGASS